MRLKADERKDRRNYASQTIIKEGIKMKDKEAEKFQKLSDLKQVIQSMEHKMQVD